jgi:hypothetical protein
MVIRVFFIVLGNILQIINHLSWRNMIPITIRICIANTQVEENFQTIFSISPILCGYGFR